jgi:transcriptional regulator with XRE-family HTH domain
MEMQNILRDGRQKGLCFYPMTLKELLNQYFSEHKQVEFANAAGVAESTVSRWKNRDAPPTFENCLWIAMGLDRDPYEIFKAAGHPEYGKLYKRFLEAKSLKPAPVVTFEPRDEPYHKLLTDLLASDQRDETIRYLKFMRAGIAETSTG